jgi:hypothetical protein
MRDDVLRRMFAVYGDLTQPGREIDRVCVELADSRTTNVLHDGPATGSEGEHQAKPDVYPGHVRYGANQWQNVIKAKAEALKKELPADTLRALAQQRGHYGSHPPKPERFELVPNYELKVMQSFDQDGNPVIAPVLSNGTPMGSKYEHLKESDKGLNYEGSQRPSATTNVRNAPRLPNGEIDMVAVCAEQNARYGHVPQTGRSNVTVGGIGPRLGHTGYDKYPTPADFKK